MHAPCNVVVLISGSGSNLQALIDSLDEDNSPARIRAVVSNRAEAFGLQRAQAADIDTHVVQHKDFACYRNTRDWIPTAGHSTPVTRNMVAACTSLPKSSTAALWPYRPA